MKPIAWTLAGSDSGGGAGIQADLKTMNALGVHGCSVITAITAQNTCQVTGYETVSPALIQAQTAALKSDLPPKALKIGMLGSTEVITMVAQCLQDVPAFKLYDPVMISTSGDRLMSPETESQLRNTLFPLVDLLTPNRLEAEALLGWPVESPNAVKAAAAAFLEMGIGSVLIKGGHSDGLLAADYWSDGKQSFWLCSPRVESTNTHGTGCTLSAAIVSAVALGYSIPDALVIAKAYVNQGLRLAPGLGKGHGPLHHGTWPMTEADLPWISSNLPSESHRPSFPDCGPTPLGFYPIIDRADWLRRLLPLGVTTVQLRIKDLTGEALENEITEAISLTRQYDCRLFINDYWELALSHGAYGVHLGQGDLETADLPALEQAGLRLGLSTHCYAEVARALAYQPSYMAVGPVFHTTTKAMPFAPQGLEALSRWRQTLSSYPLVAIGGMFLENAPDVLATGADSIAVVRDITQCEDLAGRVGQWLSLFPQRSLVLH